MHPAHQQQPAKRAGAGHRLGLIGVVLVVVGLVLCGAYRFTASDEPHSYAADAVAPYDVGVTQGRQYHLAVHGGVEAEQNLGLVPAALVCTYTVQAGDQRSLALTAEPSTSKATNVIATFVAPVTGAVHVACTGLPAIFVDDADTASADRSGRYLLLGVLALGIGVPLLLSGLRTAYRSGGPGQHDEVE